MYRQVANSSNEGPVDVLGEVELLKGLLRAKAGAPDSGMLVTTSVRDYDPISSSGAWRDTDYACPPDP
jgi:hypothetical protein